MDRCVHIKENGTQCKNVLSSSKTLIPYCNIHITEYVLVHRTRLGNFASIKNQGHLLLQSERTKIAHVRGEGSGDRILCPPKTDLHKKPECQEAYGIYMRLMKKVDISTIKLKEDFIALIFDIHLLDNTDWHIKL